MAPGKWVHGGIALIAAVWLVQPARAEIISVSGSASAAIQSLTASGQTGSDQATKTYPGTDTTLPLQVIARQADVDNGAAGSVAAQFADPQTATGPNPQEFAINLTLNSLSPEIYYKAQARTEELRGIVIHPEEVGVAAGQTVKLRGRLFLDGVLAVFAITDVQDLTGIAITLRVTIVQQIEGQDDQQVFGGSLDLSGAANRQVIATSEGDLPTSGIVDTDLASLDPELGMFRVFVLPNLILEYPYSATVGQQFALRATVEVEATNQPSGVGVAAILGTPIETLQEVINATRGAAAAKTMATALENERAAPTGEPTFPEPAPAFPACGLFGLETLLGALGLVALRAARGQRDQ